MKSEKKSTTLNLCRTLTQAIKSMESSLNFIVYILVF